ncbi:putative DNA-binding protein [Effusibacillus pohliae]|uniref:putative DNA-binding protein n=1 Tax=Effusibacillus pohliae TaxID=232270 RepID=UPI00037AE247|nr:putative DNA-binding protein [Effusibacillus pohliae]
MLEKTTRMNLLYDFYGALLTEKQRLFMELYYHDDLSLAEIAEQYHVSRQAVHDNIRRSETQLEEYEQTLRLLERHEQRVRLCGELLDRIGRLPITDAEKQDLLRMVRLLRHDGESEMT